jgi:hypothetical protein
MLWAATPHLVGAVGINHNIYGQVKPLKIKISARQNQAQARGLMRWAFTTVRPLWYW